MTETTTTWGVCWLQRKGLERRRAAGRKLRVRVTGMLVIAGDVPPALARETIESIRVRGPLVAGPAVRSELGDRILHH